MSDNQRIGGQAVIEGVMLRNSRAFSLAVREESNEVVTIYETIEKTWCSRSRLDRIPFVRGVITLFQSMWIGIRTLGISASLQCGKAEAISNAELWFSLLLAMLMGTFLFMVLPFAAAGFVERMFSGIRPVYFSLLEGIIRLSVFFVYIAAVTRIPDVRRLFAYHGAEHKVINAYESGLELNLINARKSSRYHPRCGTSFVLILIVALSLVFGFFPVCGLLQRIALRVILLPVMGGVVYELLRLTGRFRMLLLLNPGILLQRFTTREPDDAQLETALKALFVLLKHES